MKKWLVAAGLFAASSAGADTFTSAWVAPFDSFSSRDWGCFDEINPFAFAFDSRNQPFAAYPDLLARAAAAKPARTSIIPVVVNDVWDSDGKRIHTLKSAALLQYWLSDHRRLERHAEALVAAARPYDGIELDYEHVPDHLWPDYVELLARVGEKLRPQGKELVVDLEAYPLYDGGGRLAKLYWPRLGDAVDRVKVMCYYERGEFSDSPGPGASQEWIERTAKRALAVLPSDRTALAFSLAATDWQVPLSVLQARRHVARLHFRQATALRERTGAEPLWDDSFGAPYFRYEKDGRRHEVWYEDARTLGRKIELARKLGAGVSLWYLGATRPDLRAMGLCPRR